jgi:THO complex subunit 1
LRGNFHVENVTTFEDFLKTSVAGDDDVQVALDGSEEVKEDSKPEVSVAKPGEADRETRGTTSTLAVDDLYPIFWSLQHSFSNPPRLFEAENFKQFQKGLEATLAKFKEVPQVIQSGDSEQKKGGKPHSDDDYDEFASTFNPKYLTSRDLFKLEVRSIRANWEGPLLITCS